MNKWFSSFINIFFPTKCIVCATQGPDLCSSCLHSFEPSKPSNYDWITSFWNYRDPQVEIIMRYLKNYPNRRVITSLVNFITFKSIIPLESIIVPVPIHKKRFIDRGYNQSELIAEAFSKKLHIPLGKNILYKKFSTHKQGTLKSKKSRIHNLENSFGVRDKALIYKKHILIIDDITTTGSTLCEIQKTLLASGARSVSAITLAN